MSDLFAMTQATQPPDVGDSSPGTNPGIAATAPPLFREVQSEVVVGGPGQRRTFLSMAGGVVMFLIAPIAVLLVGLPIVFAIRTLIELLRWLLPGV